jgi:hypothetical protein
MVENVLTGNITTHTHSQYLTEADVYTETDPTVPSHVKSISESNIFNWNLAHGWGNHSSAGYLISIDKAMVEAVLSGTITTHDHDHLYLKSYNETDPTVASHIKSITINEKNN